MEIFATVLFLFYFVEWFNDHKLQAYGAEAGVAGLKWLPYGGYYEHKKPSLFTKFIFVFATGLYLTGGLTPKNIHLITDPHGPFLSAFHDKVLVQTTIVHFVSVHVILSGKSWWNTPINSCVGGARRKCGPSWSALGRFPRLSRNTEVTTLWIQPALGIWAWSCFCCHFPSLVVTLELAWVLHWTWLWDVVVWIEYACQ